MCTPRHPAQSVLFHCNSARCCILVSNTQGAHVSAECALQLTPLAPHTPEPPAHTSPHPLPRQQHIYFEGGASGTFTLSSWLVLVAADCPCASACVPSVASDAALTAASFDLRALNLEPRPLLCCCGAAPLAALLLGRASSRAFLREPSSLPDTCSSTSHSPNISDQPQTMICCRK